MTEPRDRLAADLAMIRTGEGLSAALVLPRDEHDADRLIALGWTRLDSEFSQSLAGVRVLGHPIEDVIRYTVRTPTADANIPITTAQLDWMDQHGRK